MHKFSDFTREELLQLYDIEGLTEKEIGSKKNRATSTVHRALVHFGIERRGPGPSSAKARTAKLNPDIVRAIHTASAAGVRAPQIRDLLAQGGILVSRQTINNIISGETWKYIKD